MKKVYLIYAKIPTVLFDSKMYQFVKNNTKYKLCKNYYIGLYAWTPHKILLDTFMDFRKGANKIYKIVTRKFSKNEFNIFRKENFYEELLYYKIPSRTGYDDDEFFIGWEPTKKDSKLDKELFFSNQDNTGKIVCTREEFTQTIEYGHDYLFEYMTQIVTAEYSVFKDKYIKALDYIGYCDEFNSMHGNEEDDFYFERYDATCYYKSYNLTYYGQPAIDIYGNKLAIFINIFYEMIVGYDSSKEIKLLIQN